MEIYPILLPGKLVNCLLLSLSVCLECGYDGQAAAAIL